MNDDETIFEYQHAALIRVVAAIFVVAGLVPEGPVLSSLSSALRRQILRVLGPAESALRRLIFFRAQGLVVKARAKRKTPSRAFPKHVKPGNRVPPFVLFDPRKWFWELAKTKRPKRGPDPRISSFDERRPAPAPPVESPSDTEIDPAGLCRRLQALHKALSDIPAQAKRLARLQAQRRAAKQSFRRTQPMRPGWPPGYRANGSHPVDKILHDCHIIALRSTAPNTS